MTNARVTCHERTTIAANIAFGHPEATREQIARAARIAAAGNGVDDLVKVDGQWLIKYRNVAAAEDK